MKGFDIKHDDLASNLAQHLAKNEDKMVWEDIPVGASGSIRPDVYVINKSFASPNPTSYEIKVSVSDFRNDVTKGKYKGYMAYSDAVIFAVPKGLISKKDVPDHCGLITFNGVDWNVVKKPTINKGGLDPELLLKLLISGDDRRTINTPVVDRNIDDIECRARAMKRVGKDVAQKLSRLDGFKSDLDVLKNLKDEMAKFFNVDKDRWCFARDCRYSYEEMLKKVDNEKIKSDIIGEMDSLKKRLISEFTMSENKINNKY